MSVPDIHFSPGDRRLTVGPRQFVLTPREADAIGYLLERRGQVVSRTELEKEVWGFRAGVRSEVVPVTMRRLRGKLGPTGPSILETIRGSGWRVPTPTVASLSVITAPTFGTPFHPRPSELTALRSLIDSGWRIVTVVGSGGAGKTRLVAELASSQPMVWAAVGEAEPGNGVLRVVLAAAGVGSEGTEALEVSLSHRDIWVVLDEAEQALDAVRSLVAAVPSGRFLVTSRQELGLPGEAIHQVAPMEGEEGESFLRNRLEASRWGSRGSAEKIPRALELLDGLPLGLELAACHPFGLDALVAELESGKLPSGPGTGRLRQALERSFERLSPEARGVALALSLCECALPEHEIASWLGDEAIAAVRELASRSLLNPERGGWQMLRTMRAFAREQVADWDALWRRFDLWLFDKTRALSTLQHIDPRGAEISSARWIADCTRAAARMPPELLPEFILALYENLCFYNGAAWASVALVVDALDRTPDSLLLQVLSCHVRGVFDLEVLEQAERSVDPDIRMYAYLVRRDQRPQTLRGAAIESLIEASVDGGWPVPDQLFLRIGRSHFLGDVERVRALEGIIRDAERYPRDQMEAATALIISYIRAGELDKADELVTLCRTVANRAGTAHFLVRSDYVVTTMVAARSARAGALAFEECGVRHLRRGLVMYCALVYGKAGRLWYALGNLERALPLLRQGTPIGGAGGVVNELLSYAAELRCGDVRHRVQLETCGERQPLFGGRYGEVTWAVFVQFMEGEVELSRAEDAGAKLAILRRRIAPQRHAIASAQVLPWIRYLLEDWERRLTALCE